MADYYNEHDRLEIERFKEEAEAGIHTCENCFHHDTDWGGACCDQHGSDFPVHLRFDPKTFEPWGLRCGDIPYGEEMTKPRNCPKWELRTRSEAAISQEHMRAYIKACDNEKKSTCLCGQCKSTTCMQKGRHSLPGKEYYE
jgi:hypothetical protein